MLFGINDIDNVVCENEKVFNLGSQGYRIYTNPSKSVTLSAQGGGGGAKTGLYFFKQKHTLGIRRLTPLECERLMGFPDEWTNANVLKGKNIKPKPISDSARYKALGNSVAIPCVQFVLARIYEVCLRDTKNI